MSDVTEEEEKVLTPEEVAGDGFGHTNWEQPVRDNSLDGTVVGGMQIQHRWIQYGNEAVCDGSGHEKHATILHPMEMVIKDETGYKIVPVPILDGAN